MGQFIDADDLTGRYAIAQDSASLVEIELIIDKYEHKYLRQLLGVTLFELFKANYEAGSGTPTGIFAEIWEPFQVDEGRSVIESEGMLEMLKGFIFFEYARIQPQKNTIAGTLKQTVENAEIISFEEADIYGRYNDAIKNYNAIQWYIEKNQTDSVYQDYNGQPKTIASPY